MKIEVPQRNFQWLEKCAAWIILIFKILTAELLYRLNLMLPSVWTQFMTFSRPREKKRERKSKKREKKNVRRRKGASESAESEWDWVKGRLSWWVWQLEIGYGKQADFERLKVVSFWWKKNRKRFFLRAKALVRFFLHSPQKEPCI